MDKAVATPFTITDASPGSAGAASGAGIVVEVEVVDVLDVDVVV
jgi:hypothetical protein